MTCLDAWTEYHLVQHGLRRLIVPFQVFLKSSAAINQTEEMWRKDNTKRAEAAARFDLLLNAVAQAEKISVSEAELASLMRDIAEATGLELENVMAVVEPQPLREQLMRDKARELIVSSAKEATA